MSEWIPVTEQLPEPGQIVLVYRSNAPMSEEMVVRTSFLYVGGYWSAWSQPTYWMPLPQPPTA
ncbi:DUF551 domain-containing protein [Pseudomonas foliumensis]|uniref:DUF551 domain-containing protein n=1 Tax=Pseudomonas folii TaxID=2762593 RepID=A0ABR7AUA8_9PSED|nr:DUF551 domain-containing protein [Pseudomonas folii]